MYCGKRLEESLLTPAPKAVMAMSGVVRFIFLLTVVWGSCLVRGKVSLLTLSDEDFNRESVGSSVQNNGGYRIQSVSLEEAVEQVSVSLDFQDSSNTSHYCTCSWKLVLGSGELPPPVILLVLPASMAITLSLTITLVQPYITLACKAQ